MNMIVFEDSEEAINGLARLIIQEPKIIIELKIIRNYLNNYGALSEETKDEEYYKKKLDIISKAETIANKDIWYGFGLHDTFNGEDNGYMLYKRINNLMVPLECSFEGGWKSNIRDFGDLKEVINQRKIKNLVTYSPFDFDTVYSQQYEIEADEDENSGLDYAHQHISIDRTCSNLLKEKGVNVTEYNEEQVKEFERNLEMVII
jgi:hypothetical protein